MTQNRDTNIHIVEKIQAMVKLVDQTYYDKQSIEHIKNNVLLDETNKQNYSEEFYQILSLLGDDNYLEDIKEGIIAIKITGDDYNNVYALSKILNRVYNKILEEKKMSDENIKHLRYQYFLLAQENNIPFQLLVTPVNPIKRIQDTLKYVNEHHINAKLKDIFFVLGGDKYDDRFYQIILLLNKYGDTYRAILNEINNLNGTDDENKTQLYNILSCVYTFAIADNHISPKQIKKLRHAYYEFAKHNDFDLNELLKDNANNFNIKLQANRKSKYGFESIDKPEKNPRNAKKTKKLNESIAEELQPNIAFDEAYFQNIKNHIEQNVKKLEVTQLKRIRHNLRELYHIHHIPQELAWLDKIISDKTTRDKDSVSKYIDSHSRVSKVLEKLRDNPVLTNIRHRIPFTFNKNDMDEEVFQIANQLANMGLHVELMGLINIFLAKEPAFSIDIKLYNANCKASLEVLLKYLYQIFNFLSVRDDIDQAELKKLKKFIHAFAEKNDFEKRLFNLRKLYHKNQHDKEVAEQLAHNANRKYAYIDKLANEITAKKLRERHTKKWLKWVARSVTVLIAVGEGLVAAVFLGWAIIPAILIFGVAGAIVSYFLFKDDCYSTLKEYFIDGIFKDEKGQTISPAKKTAIMATILFTTAGALINAIFAYSSTLAAVTGLLGAFSIVFPPAGLLLAGLIGLAVFVTFSLVFYRVMADFIKNDRIKQLGSYFKRTFYDVWLPPENWLRMKTREKIWHYTQVVCGVAFRALVGLVSVAACALLTVLSIGVAYHQAVAFMKQIPILTAKMIEYIAKIGVYALAVPINSFFYWKSIIPAFNAVQDGVIGLVNCIMHPKTTWQHMKTTWRELGENKIRTTNLVFSTIKRVFLTGATALNAMGMGGGATRNPTSISHVQAVTHLSAEQAKKLIHTNMIGASLAVNLGAVGHVTRTPEEVKQPLAQDKQDKHEITYIPPP